MNYKPIIIVVLVVTELYSLMILLLTLRSEKNPIPENVADVYDRETYAKWRSYHAEKTAFGVISSTASFIVSLLLLLFNVYAAWARLFPDDIYS